MRKLYFTFVFLLFFLFIHIGFGQQFSTVIDRCGGSHVITTNPILDNDSDGMHDNLEQLLLQKFVPAFIGFNDDNCPGPNTSSASTDDTNIVICRVYFVPQQYAAGNSSSLILENPTSIINNKCLQADLYWYQNTVIINGAILYGRDCGITSHVADIEGFSVTLSYTGSDVEGGWRYDTTMNNWKGMKLQTVSHAGTFCESVETKFYNTSGRDTVYISPDKHGNHISILNCNSSFICDPSCTSTPSPKKIKIVNAGEQNAPLVADLGNYYYQYVGENPWSNISFLSSMGGSAGEIKVKLIKPYQDNLLEGVLIDSCQTICKLYQQCFVCSSADSIACLTSCAGIPPSATGCNSPAYNCTASEIHSFSSGQNKIIISPNPFLFQTTFIFSEKLKNASLNILNLFGNEVKSIAIPNGVKNFTLYRDNLPSGIYFIQLLQHEEIVVMYKLVICD